MHIVNASRTNQIDNLILFFYKQKQTTKNVDVDRLAYLNRLIKFTLTNQLVLYYRSILAFADAHSSFNFSNIQFLCVRALTRRDLFVLLSMPTRKILGRISVTRHDIHTLGIEFDYLYST